VNKNLKKTIKTHTSYNNGMDNSIKNNRLAIFLAQKDSKKIKLQES
jgi:hypothetical protein